MSFNIINKKVSLNNTVFLNILSTCIVQGVAFFTMPIFTRVLGTEQYGLYAVFSSWATIISILMPLGLSNCNSWGQYYFRNEYVDFRNSIIIFNTIISMLFCIVVFLFGERVSLWLGYNYRLYLVLLLTAFSTNIVGAISGFLIFEKKAIINFFISIFLSVLNVSLSLFFIFCFKFDNLYEGRVYGHFLSYFIVSLIVILYILFRKTYSLKIDFLKYGIIFGGPVVFHSLANYILGQSDRVMMQKMHVLNSDIGIYSLFYSFCNVLIVILSALNTSFSPFYMDYVDKDDQYNLITKSKNFIELFTIICIGFLLLSREVSYVMASKEYYSGINLIPILVVSIYFIFMYQFAVNFEFYFRKTKVIAGGTIGAAIINIVLNYYFIKSDGMYGAAYATLISYGVLYLFHYIIAKSIKLKNFYINFYYFIFWIIALLTISYLFYALANQVYLRWIIGGLLGIFELYKIWCRKSIF